MRLGMDSFSFQVDSEGRRQYLDDKLLDAVRLTGGVTLDCLGQNETETNLMSLSSPNGNDTSYGASPPSS